MIKIDIKDRKILYQLDINSRQSFSQIGKKVGLPKTVVAYRVKKLKDLEIIKNFYTVIDSFKLGYLGFRLYLSYQYTTYKIENDIVNYFINNKLNWWTISAEGRYDLAVIMWVKEINDFYSFWEETLRRYRDYFQKQKFSVYVQMYEYFHSYILNENVNFDRMNFEITGGGKRVKTDELDFQILRLLAPNARISIKEIAKRIKTTVPIINYRVKKLINSGIIQGFRTDIDFSKLGYQFFKADIYLKDYNYRSEIINYIKINPYLIRIDRSVGISDLELEFHVKNLNHFQNIMSDINIRFHNYIKNYKYLYARKLHKMNYMPGI